MMEEIGAVPESPFWLEINGRRVGSWTCSPEHLPALAAGWLLSQGYLDANRRPPALQLVDDDGIPGIRVALPAELVLQGDLERRHRREHGCGLHYYIRCAPERIRDGAGRAPLPEAELFAPLFRSLFALSRRGDLGGLHAAALSDGRELLFPIEEVGRHNAVDKVIGQAIMAGTPLAGLGLVLTARISGEIALKAARAGLAWVASRSIPTTLALEVAALAGLPLLARAAGKEARLHEATRTAQEQPS
jgi:FdhD protein